MAARARGVKNAKTTGGLELPQRGDAAGSTILTDRSFTQHSITQP